MDMTIRYIHQLCQEVDRLAFGDMPDELPATAYTVLGLLSFDRELSGYDIKKWADASIRYFWWAPAVSNVYRELQRLEGLGLVEAVDHGGPSARNRKLFRITGAGRQAVERWNRTAPLGALVLKHPVVLRLWLGDLADPAELRALIEEHAVATRRMLKEIRESVDHAASQEAMQYPAAALAWATALYEADLAAAAAALAQLDVKPSPPRPKRSRPRR